MVERLVDVLDSRGNLRHVLPIRIEGSRNSNLLYEMKAFGLVVGRGAVEAGALQKAIFNSANSSSIATDAKGVIQMVIVRTSRALIAATTIFRPRSLFRPPRPGAVAFCRSREPSTAAAEANHFYSAPVFGLCQHLHASAAHTSQHLHASVSDTSLPIIA